MRKLGALLAACLLASALAAGAAEAATAGGAEVLRMTVGCNLGWDDESGDIYSGAIGPCDIVNVRTPDGGYRLVLRGQIPADWMDEFIADGSPRTFAPGCLVNYGFLLQSGTWEPLLNTASVRHFTPDGGMTEICSPYRPD